MQQTEQVKLTCPASKIIESQADQKYNFSIYPPAYISFCVLTINPSIIHCHLYLPYTRLRPLILYILLN